MKIAVTGGAGFIGSNVAEAYVEGGHEVLVIDDLSSGVKAQIPSKATFVHADVRSPEAAKAIEAFKPGVLNLHAAQIDVRRSVTEPGLDADVNIGGALNALEAARRGGALKRVIYAASGGSMYGDSQIVPTPETEPVAPVSPYGVSKATVEIYLAAYKAMYGVHYVALRYANVYGPRQNPHGEAGVVAIFTDRLLGGKGCTIYGDGGQTRDFVFVYDVVNANVAALTCELCGGVNISTGVETDLNKLYKELAKASGIDRPATYAEGKVGEQRRSVLANGKATKSLRWVPQWDVERGLASTIEWFRKHQS